MSIPLKTIYSYFKTGYFPTQTQFQDSWSSFWHKDESNIATVDEKDALGNVYTKNQSNDKFMSLSDFVNDDQKILAEKIEALGLTTLIEAVETTISGFADHSGSYKFEDNDFIAIPDTNGNYSLHMFKGGAKTDKTNYLPTGISNVTIGMVEGLQTVLNTKMNKPSGNGSFFIRGLGQEPIYASISPATNYLLSWDGSDFKESNVYYNAGKFGVGTTSPTETLHLNNGRIRSKAVVLDENSEVLPGQVTYNNSGFYGTDLTGIRRKLMNQTYADYLALISTFTDAQKDEARVKLRKVNENYSLNQPIINNVLPPIVDKTLPFTQYVTIVGLNLFLDTFTQGAAQIEMKNSATGEITMINSFTSYQYAPDRITFGLDFSTYDEGDYSFRVFHNNQWSLPNLTKVLRVRTSLSPLPIPVLTWELADQTGPKTSIPGVQTSNNRIVISTNAVQTSIYAQSSEITTQQEMNDGVLLVFSVQMQMYDDISFGNLLMGFVNSIFVNNDYQDFGFAVNGTFQQGVKVIFSQSGIIKTLPSNGFVVTDLVYVTIKNGVAEILFLNSGVNAIEVIPFNTPLKLKIGNKRITNDVSHLSKIDCQLINKYSLI